MLCICVKFWIYNYHRFWINLHALQWLQGDQCLRWRWFCKLFEFLHFSRVGNYINIFLHQLIHGWSLFPRASGSIGLCLTSLDSNMFQPTLSFWIHTNQNIEVFGGKITGLTDDQCFSSFRRFRYGRSAFNCLCGFSFVFSPLVNYYFQRRPLGSWNTNCSQFSVLNGLHQVVGAFFSLFWNEMEKGGQLTEKSLQWTKNLLNLPPFTHELL